MAEGGADRSGDERAARLAAALRANLRKRKDRQHGAATPADTPQTDRPDGA